jgi:hypothetical protein
VAGENFALRDLDAGEPKAAEPVRHKLEAGLSHSSSPSRVSKIATDPIAWSPPSIMW